MLKQLTPQTTAAKTPDNKPAQAPVCLQIQWKPINVITLGLIKNDNTNQVKTTMGFLYTKLV